MSKGNISGNLTDKDVKKLGKLASIPLTDVDYKRLPKQLSETINYVNVLDELELANEDILTQVTGQSNRFREDDIKPSLSQKEALSGTDSSYNGYFMVPHVLGGGDDA